MQEDEEDSAVQNTRKDLEVESIIQPIGQPFYPIVRSASDGGWVKRSLPENIYSALMISWINSGTLAESTTVQFFIQELPIFLALVLSYVAQITMAHFLVMAASNELSDTCENGATLLRYVAVFAFCAALINDMYDTLNTHLWLQCFKTVAAHEQLKVQKYREINRHWKGPDDPEDPQDYETFRPVTGLTRGERICFYLFAVVGKLFVAAYVCVGGVGIVVRSESSFDIVMNSVAALFVLDFDDMAYQYFITDQMKLFGSNIPAFSVSLFEYEKNGCFACFGIFAFYIFVLLTFGLCMATYLPWCS